MCHSCWYILCVMWLLYRYVSHVVLYVLVQQRELGSWREFTRLVHHWSSRRDMIGQDRLKWSGRGWYTTPNCIKGFTLSQSVKSHNLLSSSLLKLCLTALTHELFVTDPLQLLFVTTLFETSELLSSQLSLEHQSFSLSSSLCNLRAPLWDLSLKPQGFSLSSLHIKPAPVCSGDHASTHDWLEVTGWSN